MAQQNQKKQQQGGKRRKTSRRKSSKRRGTRRQASRLDSTRPALHPRLSGEVHQDGHECLDGRDFVVGLNS